jgi:hypothetical protein
VVLAAFAWRKPAAQLAVHALASLLIVSVLWFSFKAGGGAYYPYYESKLLGLVGITRNVETPLGAVLNLREGFVRSGGATNIVRRVHHRENASILRQALENAIDFAIGTAVLLLPISLLKWLSIVDFAGGRGLLLVTDLDTLFIDLSLVAVVVLLRRAWSPRRPNMPFTAFTLVLCVLLATLMAFVVTNYGSLFRLRLMVAALIWLLPLSLASSDELAALAPPGRTALAVGAG